MKVAAARDAVSHSSSRLSEILAGDGYANYYTSMYLIQDTADAVGAHQVSGFSSDPLRAYIEFWGVMQALIIQQDAICELHKSIVGEPPSIDVGSAWRKLRDLRNRCVGHPAKSGSKKRTFMGRRFGDYSAITYEEWDGSTNQSTHPAVDLAAMIASYDDEASKILWLILERVKEIVQDT